MPTPHIEEYLESIYRLSCDDTCASSRCFVEGAVPETGNEGTCRKIVVRPSDIAELIGLSRPSVTTALRRMESAGLITRQKRGVVLTEQGFSAAQAVLRRHRIAERFLTDICAFDKETVHDEACALEHALSDRLTNRLEEILSYPETCPHGNLIPPRDPARRSATADD